MTTVTASLSGGTSGEAITVTVAAASVYAALAADGGFALSAARTLTIASGSTASAGVVTITAVDDAIDSTDKSATVSGRVAGGHGLVAAPSSLTLTIADDDAQPTSALALGPASISETGGVATVTATLSNPSAAAVTLTVSAVPGTGAAVGDYALSAANTLTVAAGQTTSAGTVTVTAVGNAVDSADKGVTVSATATGGRGVAAPANAMLTIRDDEADLDVGPVTGRATEGGGSATFTVALLTRPGAAVTVTIRSRDEGEGRASPASLTFTTTDWSRARTVTVMGVDDPVDDGDATYVVRLSSSSGDPSYHGLVDEVSVTTTDDDAAPTVALSVAPATIAENGGAATVTATLSHPSAAATTVTVTAVPGLYTVDGDTAIVIAAGATANASDTVTVAAVDDAIDNAADRAGAVTGEAANAMGVDAVTGATLTLADDDTKGLAFAPEMMATEAGDPAGAGYTVALESEPTGPVTVAVASGNPDVTVTPDSLTFTATDWNRAQAVTVTAAPDEDDYADTAALVHTARGGGYGAVAGTVSVGVEEDLRILAAAEKTEAVYSIGGRVVGVTFTPLSGEAVPPLEGSAFALGRDTASRVAVDIDPESIPSSGLHICLPVSDALLAAAAGRTPRLLHHEDGAWAAVAGSEYEEEKRRVCAPDVTAFSPFSVGYEDSRPAFAAKVADQRWTVDDEVSLTLPPVEEGTGDPPLTYALTGPGSAAPLRLPAGLRFDPATRTLSGTPTAPFDPGIYTWTARDVDDQTAALSFTIEVLANLEPSRARLKAINESILPELARAQWASALEAVTARLESPDGGDMLAAATAALKTHRTRRRASRGGRSWPGGPSRSGWPRAKAAVPAGAA